MARGLTSAKPLSSPVTKLDTILNAFEIGVQKKIWIRRVGKDAIFLFILQFRRLFKTKLKIFFQGIFSLEEKMYLFALYYLKYQ